MTRRLSLLAGLALTLSAAAAQAQTADEIISRHFAAIGGEDNWRSVSTIKLGATTRAGDNLITVNIAIIQEKDLKVDFSANGMTGWAIITNTAGWTYNQASAKPPQEMTEADVRQSQYQLDIQGGLLDYKRKGNTVTYDGMEAIDGKACYKLKVTYPAGVKETMYIDSATCYHIRSKIILPTAGGEKEIISKLGNFKLVSQGIRYPMSIENGNGMLVVDRIAINAPLDASYFTPVVAAPRPPKSAKPAVKKRTH